MAPLLEDPRIRQTWNHISHNAETATETAAAGIWSFTHQYVNPCFASIGSSLDQCSSKCFPDREERARRIRERERTRGRAEYSFDFYDDWDEDHEGSGSGGLLGWGNDELDRLLAGSGGTSQATEQPSGRKRGMSYGTRGRGRRKSAVDDPTIIPSTNSIGFLQRLPWKLGGTLRYKPSAADLQDHPGSHKAEMGDEAEGEPLIDNDHTDEEDAGHLSVTRTRQRSSTTGSGDTSDSFRSRGDLFASDGEDDAVPLSDEFAVVLERRNTGSFADDRSSGKTRSSKGKQRLSSRPLSRTLSRTSQSSSLSRPRAGMNRDSSASKLSNAELPSTDIITPSLTDLQQQEEQLHQEEESELERKRVAAAILARQRGLSISSGLLAESEQGSVPNEDSPTPTSDSIDTPQQRFTATPSSPDAETARHVEEDQDFVPARLPNF